MARHEEKTAMPIFAIDPPDTLSFVGKYGQKLWLLREFGVDYHRRVCDLSKGNEQRRCSKSMEENLDKNVNKMWIKILLIEESLIKQL